MVAAENTRENGTLCPGEARRALGGRGTCCVTAGHGPRASLAAQEHGRGREEWAPYCRRLKHLTSPLAAQQAFAKRTDICNSLFSAGRKRFPLLSRLESCLCGVRDGKQKAHLGKRET